jgi:quercetin dioxygenase-like cupin family protein
MIFRMYTGDDGETHLDEMNVSQEELATIKSTGEVTVRSADPGRFVDWHTAPRRQYVFTLAGRVEIGLGDGSRYYFGPGDGVLAEDLTGHGHTTRVVGGSPRITLTIPIAD